MKNTKQKTGWVIRNRKTKRFLNRLSKSVFTKNIENARVFPNRTEARGEYYPGEEAVMQVELNGKNRAVTVIGGNGPNCKF